jgi:RimJ/RimL family protein N-acetyltransferase
MNAAIFSGKLVRLAVFDPEKDADLMANWNRDSEYARLLDAGPAYQWTPKQVKEWMEKEKDLHFFIIRTLADDRAIGLIDLSGFNWPARHAWVGIGLGEREFWGKGYGTEAMAILLGYAFEELNLNRVNLNVFEYNERAIKSYLKCGFVEEGRARKAMLREGERWDIVFMGILKSEWEERKRE